MEKITGLMNLLVVLFTLYQILPYIFKNLRLGEALLFYKANKHLRYIDANGTESLNNYFNNYDQRNLYIAWIFKDSRLVADKKRKMCKIVFNHAQNYVEFKTANPQTQHNFTSYCKAIGKLK